MLKKSALKAIMLVVITSACLVLGELGARLAGYKSWNVKQLDIKVEPGGKFYQKHPTLGYAHLPGAFQVTLDDKYRFKATNGIDTLRITHPQTVSSSALKPEIWVFGDSVTYGWSVSDEETYPWLLQESHPEFEFINFGVNGYGTLQSLIQLKEALQKRRKPKIVILAYASWLDVRNTFVRGRRKMLAVASDLGPTNQPYATLNGEQLEQHFDALSYREFPLMRCSALVNMLEEAYNHYEERRAQSHEVTKLIVKQFADVCRINGIDLIVANFTSDPTTADMEKFCRENQLATVDVYVDLSAKENNNLPFDSHPSALAQSRYAQKLSSYLVDKSYVEQPGVVPTQ